MAECYTDVVCRRVEQVNALPFMSLSAAVAEDDAALVRAYEEAVKSYQSPNANYGYDKENCSKDEKSEMSRSCDTATQKWIPGSKCRAVWSGDGLLYPAVVVWVKGDCARVKFEDYGNEEVVDLSGLLLPEEEDVQSLNAVAEVFESYLDANRCTLKDWKVKEDRTIDKEDHKTSSSSSFTVVGRSSENTEPGSKNKPYKCGEGQEDTGPRDPAGLLPSSPSYVYPPEVKPEEINVDLDSDMTELFNILMSWYLCGYHTGFYMATQQGKAVEKGGKDNQKFG